MQLHFSSLLTKNTILYIIEKAGILPAFFYVSYYMEGISMVTINAGIDKWKEEQLSYFKEYIKSFTPGTKEYNQIARGIFDLEKGR